MSLPIHSEVASALPGVFHYYATAPTKETEYEYWHIEYDNHNGDIASHNCIIRLKDYTTTGSQKLYLKVNKRQRHSRFLCFSFQAVLFLLFSLHDEQDLAFSSLLAFVLLVVLCATSPVSLLALVLSCRISFVCGVLLV